MSDGDLYGGFADYSRASEAQDILNDAAVQDAVVRTSHGRRPGTLVKQNSTVVNGRLATAAGRIDTATGGLMRGKTAALTTAAGMAGGGGGEGARPMTSMRGAGYSSKPQQRTTTFEQTGAALSKPEESAEEKCRQMEAKVNELLEQSISEYERGDFRAALDKAKEAGRKERAAVKLREQLGAMEQANLDLTFSVLFNLAHQYTVNEMYNEALNTYQVIIKNKVFTNAGRLKVNIGNIYFKKKDYSKAIKNYRMALDQIPAKEQKEARTKILNNIGVTFVKLGKYDEAVGTFEHCMEEKADFRTGLNLVLCAYTLEDKDRMRDTFQRLLDIPLDLDDEDKYVSHSNDPNETVMLEVIKHDSLRQWERQRRQEAERTILTAAKIISPAIAPTFSEGYSWCVDSIKRSTYAELASDLEINKAIELLRQRDLAAATEVLQAFEKKDSKVASAAANNLAFLNFLQGRPEEAIKYADQALSNDRYNSNALVNSGNVRFVQGQLDEAREFYREALGNEATCVEALYNQGLACKKMGKLEEALDCFYKLHSILRNNVQVLCQLGNIYEQLEDTAQAIDIYTQASNLAPTDPSILAKLGELYDAEGDKSQSFQCYYDSYRYHPSNIDVIEWLGAYYIDAQFCEKAVNYFDRASIMQPNEVKWQLMTASCHRRSGNYQRALDTYKLIHKRFPDNAECLKFLVRLCADLGMPETSEYANKLKKVERVRELRDQRADSRASASGGGGGQSRSALLSRGHTPNSANSLPPNAGGRPSNSRGTLRTASARIDLTNLPDQYQITHKQQYDTSYSDPVGHVQPKAERPKTGMRPKTGAVDEGFDDEQIDDLLPD